MKKQRLAISILFILFFTMGVYAQQPESVDEYNGWKSLGVLVAMIVALVFLYNSSRRKTATVDKKQATPALSDEDISSDEAVVAIAMALDDAKGEIHDYENTVLTLKKISRSYSPWSSKIFGLRQIPLKK